MSAIHECPFCSPELSGRTLCESERARVIFSNPRLMKGHLLVIPKRHVELPWELTAEEHREIFNLVDIFQKKLAQTLGTGYDLRQNYRPFLPQGRVKVDHVHYHLLPRTLNDELHQESMIFEAKLFTDLPRDEAEEVTRQLKV